MYDNIIHGSLVKRLRRRPLTAETRVRFPYGLLYYKYNSPTRENVVIRQHFFLQIINIQPDGSKAKPYQVKQIRNLILKYGLEV